MTGVEMTTMTKRTIYLANPYGFSASLAGGPLQDLVWALEELGAEVWEPFTCAHSHDPASPGWAWRTGQRNVDLVRGADAVFAVVNGCPPDEGVAFEIGYAVACWRKPVFFFRDDFRRCADSDAYPLNLMLFAGHDANGWRMCWYESVAELADPGKGLARWLGGEEIALAGPVFDDRIAF